MRVTDQRRAMQPVAKSAVSGLVREHGISRDQATRLLRKFRKRADELQAAILVLKSADRRVPRKAAPSRDPSVVDHPVKVPLEQA